MIFHLWCSKNYKHSHFKVVPTEWGNDNLGPRFFLQRMRSTAKYTGQLQVFGLIKSYLTIPLLKS